MILSSASRSLTPHSLTQTREVSETSTDSEGRTTTTSRTETYTEKVTSFSTTEPILYRLCEDRSLPISCSTAIVRLDLSINWAPGDDATAEHLRVTRLVFDDANRNRDTHYDSGISVNIEGFQPKMLGLLRLDSKPWWMSYGVYVLCTLVGLSWPYRLLFDRACLHAAYSFDKVIFI